MSMYELAVKNDFIAQHFLIGGDWGGENQKHSHHYQIEIQLEGKTLDNHGFLVDIVKIKEYLDKLVSYFQDTTLNDLPEFEGINPSIENLARIAYQLLDRPIHELGVAVFKIKVWENDIAWVSFQEM